MSLTFTLRYSGLWPVISVYYFQNEAVVNEKLRTVIVGAIEINNEKGTKNK